MHPLVRNAPLRALGRPTFVHLSTVMSPFRISSAILLIAAPCAAATLPHEDAVSLENFVVTASPYARPQSELAQPTTVVAGRELLLNPASSLGELLSDQPGISSTYFGPGASRPVIRGLGGDRIRMLTDGVGIFDASVISPDHAVAVDPLLIERVEVVRGPATLLYGSNAVGGVVNTIDHRIHTTRPNQPFNARVEARVSSVNDEESAGAVMEGGAGSLAWHLDAYRRNAGDVEIPGFAESGRRRAADLAEAAEHGEEAPTPTFGYIPNTAVAADGGAAGFSFIGERSFAGLAYSGHNAVYGIPAAAHQHQEDGHEEGEAEEEEEARETAEGVRIDLRQRRMDLQGGITEPFGIFNEARVKVGIARYRHMELEGDEVGTVFRNRGFDGRLELLHQPIGAFSGALGWQGTQSDFEAEGEEAFLPSSRTRTHALFLFEETQTKPLGWQLGARVERQAIDLRDGSLTSRNETNFSVSSGAVWTLDDTWTISASLAHAERAPNVQELFADGPHLGTSAYEIGDPALNSERSLALDLTLRKRAGFVTGSATVFANRFDGYIYENPTGLIAVAHDDHFHFVPPDDEEAEHGGLPVYRYVQHEALFHGAELETVFHLYHAEERQLDLTLGADFVRARNSTTRSPLPRITPARLRAGLDWRSGGLALGTDAQFVDHQHRIAPGETPSAGYVLTSAYVSYRFTVDRMILDLFLRGTNLGDEEARVHTSFLKDIAPLPGRNVTVGLRVSF
jgi:iron complex outermembrane receptor protein